MSGSLGTSSGTDASIPLQAGRGIQQPPNPLQTIGEFANTQNALNQAKMFPTLQQRQQVGLQSDQAALVQQQKQLADAALVPLLAKKGLITIGDVTGAFGGAEKGGIVTAPAVAGFSAIPMTGDPATDDASIRAYILANAQAPANAAAAVTPKSGTIDVGPEIKPVNIGAPGMPNQGVITPAGTPLEKGLGPQYVQTGAGSVPTVGGQPVGAAIPNAPSPAEMNQLQQVWNPAKQQFDYVPRQQIAPMVNGAAQPVGGGAPMVPGLPITGRIQSPATGSAASAPLGTAQEAEASAMHAGAARERANNYQATIYPIEGAINSLSGADTGRGGEILNNVRGLLGDTPLKYLNAFLPGSLSDQAKRALYDEAQKYTTGMALGGPGGSRSDAGATASMAANPNVHISNTAALAVAKSILAQRRMEQVGTLAFNNATGPDGQPLPASQYDRFMNQWNTAQDPRAFAVDKMTPAERAQLVNNMGGIHSSAYQKFKASYKAGLQTGVLPNPGGG